MTKSDPENLRSGDVCLDFHVNDKAHDLPVGWMRH